MNDEETFSELDDNALYKNIIADAPSGLYMCDAKTYDMIYANKSVLDAVENCDYTGKKCYKFLIGRDTPCPWCKMSDMCEEKYLEREFDVPRSRKHLNMRGKIIDLNGRTVHIEYVSDDTYRYNEQKMKEVMYSSQMKLLSHLCNEYVGNYRINISKNLVLKGFGENCIVIDSFECSENIEGFIKNAQMLIPDKDEKRKYEETFCRDSLFENFYSGKNELNMVHRAMFDGKNLHWYRSTAILMQNPSTGDIEGYISAIDIHKEKIRQFLTEKSLCVSGDKLICIDIINNTHMLFECSDMSTPIYRNDSQKVLNECITKNCVIEERNSVVEKIRISTVIKELEKNDTYMFFYTLKLQDGLHYKQATYSYLDKEFGLLSLLLSDITEIHRQQEMHQKRLEKALQDAEKASFAKTDFLSRMSHDMRTPMNGILGLSYLMEDMDNIEDVRKELPKLRESGEYLLQLINDILDVNKVERGKLVLCPTLCDEQQVFDSIIAMIKPQMNKKNIEFNFEKINIFWEYMMLDSQRVKQIFLNLLGNAVKFTPEGGKIDFVMELVSEENGVIRDKFIIRDNGIGMKSEFLSKLFTPFSQENRIQEGLGGSGLGLSIVKNLVELMGGCIDVKSEVNKGTEFTLYLNFPLADGRDIEEREKIKGSKAELKEGLKILLCEDHPLNAGIAKRLLEKKKAIVTWVENGKAGVDTFRDSKENYYDIILMDIRMPVMDGIEAAKTIRMLERADAKIIPIIAMTANAYEEDVEKSIAAGMNEHLAKPIEPEKMYDVIAKYVHK